RAGPNTKPAINTVQRIHFTDDDISTLSLYCGSAANDGRYAHPGKPPRWHIAARPPPSFQRFFGCCQKYTFNATWTITIALTRVCGRTRTPVASPSARMGTMGVMNRAAGDQPPVHPCAFV